MGKRRVKYVGIDWAKGYQGVEFDILVVDEVYDHRMDAFAYATTGIKSVCQHRDRVGRWGAVASDTCLDCGAAVAPLYVVLSYTEVKRATG